MGSVRQATDSGILANATTLRVDVLRLDEGKLQVAWQLPLVKDYNGDMQRPPDFGRSELRVTKDTRVWKGDRPMKLTEVKIGDLLLINLTGEQPGSPARCTDLWIGEDTHKLVSEARQKKQKSAKPAK